MPPSAEAADATERPTRQRKFHAPPTPLPVESIDAKDLSEADFFMNYVLPNRPLVIRGAIEHWPARHKWNRAYFEENHAERPVKAAPLPPSGANVWFEDASVWKHEPEELPGVRLPDRLLAVSGMRHEMSFGDLLQKLHNKPSEGETLWYADGGGNMEKDFGFLCDDIGKPGQSHTRHSAPRFVDKSVTPPFAGCGLSSLLLPRPAGPPGSPKPRCMARVSFPDQDALRQL